MKTKLPFLILLKALGLPHNKIFDVVKNNKEQVNSLKKEKLNSQESLDELHAIFLEHGINLV